MFCIQQVFSSLHKIQIEPLMADGLFWRCFYTFLDLNSGIYLAVDGTVTSLPVFIWNILNCVPKTNQAFMELERHAGKWIMFILGWSNPLKLERSTRWEMNIIKVSGKTRPRQSQTYLNTLRQCETELKIKNEFKSSKPVKDTASYKSVWVSAVQRAESVWLIWGRSVRLLGLGPWWTTGAFN